MSAFRTIRIDTDPMRSSNQRIEPMDPEQARFWKLRRAEYERRQREKRA